MLITFDEQKLSRQLAKHGLEIVNAYAGGTYIEKISKSRHKYFKCGCNRPGCQFCDGGLGSCTVCGGFEGTLATQCPGIPLSEQVLEAIYKGGLDFKQNVWVVKPCSNTKPLGSNNGVTPTKE